MGNCFCIDSIDDEFDKHVVSFLAPKMNTHIQFCEPCDKNFYINNNNTCYECIFNHKEFCKHENTSSHLSELNNIMDGMIKHTSLDFCLKSKDINTKMPFNQIDITNIFKATEKNKEDIKKLNDIIDNVENMKKLNDIISNLEGIIAKYKSENELDKNI
jgi:hypothetical protein